MSVSLAAVFAAPGLALGSFLNVVASRVPLRMAIGSSRSRCMSCEHEIAWYDNVPLLSFAVLRGRCRSCSSRIPARYPLVELVTPILVVASVLHFGITLDAVVAAAFCIVLVAVSVIDLEYRIVPNRIVVPAAVVAVVVQSALHPGLEWLVGGLGASAFLLAAALAYPRGMGMGDVKLALLLGVVLGRTVPVALMVGMVVALVPAGVLFARHGAAARRIGIPFAPFLALGGIVALFWGEPLLDAYVRLLT